MQCCDQGSIEAAAEVPASVEAIPQGCRTPSHRGLPLKAAPSGREDLTFDVSGGRTQAKLAYGARLSAELESSGRVTLTEWDSVGGRCVCLTLDGKYEIRHTANGALTAWRHGSPWRDLTGDKMVPAMHTALSDVMRQISNAELQGRRRRRRRRPLQALVGRMPFIPHESIEQWGQVSSCTAGCIVARQEILMREKTTKAICLGSFPPGPNAAQFLLFVVFARRSFHRKPARLGIPLL